MAFSDTYLSYDFSILILFLERDIAHIGVKFGLCSIGDSFLANECPVIPLI